MSGLDNRLTSCLLRKGLRMVYGRGSALYNRYRSTNPSNYFISTPSETLFIFNPLGSNNPRRSFQNMIKFILLIIQQNLLSGNVKYQYDFSP